MKYLTILVLFFLTLESYAQGKKGPTIAEKEKKEEDKKIPEEDERLKLFTLDDWKKSFNTSFATVLGGAGTNNEIGNYASFDPVNGAFNFKGSIAIGDVEKKVNFLSFALKGSILSDNTAKLLKNTKVNTNTSLSGEYHFFMKVWKTSIRVDKGIESVYNVRGAVVENERRKRINEVKDVKIHRERITKLKLEKAAADKMLILLDQMRKTSEAEVVKITNDYKVDPKDTSKCAANPASCYLEALAKEVQKLNKTQKDKDSVEKQIQKLSILIDSTDLVINNWNEGLKLEAIRKINREQRKKMQDIKDSSLIAGYMMTWITGIGSIGNTKVYQYDVQKTFNNQISENTLHNNSLGGAINLLMKSSISKRLWLFNLGATYGRGNNADTLSTTDINQEYAYKNQSGDSTRKITSKYSAYTDPIDVRQAVTVFGNAYLIFGARASGLHFYSSYLKPKKRTGSLNVGLGYIASFKSLKKDTPIFTTELYIELRDISGSVSESKLHNRLEAGIKLTLPFNFF